LSARTKIKNSIKNYTYNYYNNYICLLELKPVLQLRYNN